MSSGIYAIRSRGEVVYVGQSKNIPRRWQFHKYELKNNKHKNVYLQRLYDKYGLDFEVLEYVGDVDLLTTREIHYIRAIVPRCNMTVPSENDRWCPSTERNNKISKALLGKPKSKSHRENISKGRTGIKLGYTVWNAKLISYGGKSQSLSKWEDDLGFSRGALMARIRRGWTIEKALSLPSRKMNSPLCSVCGHKKELISGRKRCKNERGHQR